ncbi:MAG TPA: hypothetical protein VGB21_02955, partial [Candidatus Methylomirabilis sp.]
MRPSPPSPRASGPGLEALDYLQKPFIQLGLDPPLLQKGNEQLGDPGGVLLLNVVGVEPEELFGVEDAGRSARPLQGEPLDQLRTGEDLLVSVRP